jgi:hypothetical protein
MLLLGVQPFLGQALASVPSVSQDPHIEWSINSLRKIGEVTWSGPTPKLFAPNGESSAPKAQEMVVSSARRIDASSAIFTVKGIDTKSCILRFDQPIVDVQIRHIYGEESQPSADGPVSRIPKGSPYPIPPEGANVVSLWSRTWNPEFEVTVKWNATEDANSGEKQSYSLWKRIFSSQKEKWLTKTGRIGCQYTDNGENQLTGLNELFEHLPDWATATTQRALLIADRQFSI